MSQSTNGQICFGILYNEGYEFPWHNEQWDYDIETWWTYKICQYKDPFELRDSNGNYFNGIKPSKEKISLYFDSKTQFQKENPIQVELVNYCSGDFPLYIIATPNSCIDCRRGFPEIFNPNKLHIIEKEQQELIDFCTRYCPQEDIIMKWYLSSYQD